MPNQKEVRKLIKAAEKWQGWRVEQTKKGWILFPPNKDIAGIAVHKTPSDYRGWKNMIQRLKKAGAPL